MPDGQMRSVLTVGAYTDNEHALGQCMLHQETRCRNAARASRTPSGAQSGGLVVQVIVVVGSGAVKGSGRGGGGGGRSSGRIPEPEVGAEASGLLERLREGLVAADVGVGHGAAGVLHRLLKVGARDAGHEVRVILHRVWVREASLFLLDILLDCLSAFGPPR